MELPAPGDSWQPEHEDEVTDFEALRSPRAGNQSPSRKRGGSTGTFESEGGEEGFGGDGFDNPLAGTGATSPRSDDDAKDGFEDSSAEV